MIITRRAVGALARTTHNRLVPAFGRGPTHIAGAPHCSIQLLPLLQLITSRKATATTTHSISGSGSNCGSAGTPLQALPSAKPALRSTQHSPHHRPLRHPLGRLCSLFTRRRRRPATIATASPVQAAPGALTRPAATARRIAHLGSSVLRTVSSAAFTKFLGAATAFALTRRGLRRLVGRRAHCRAVPMQQGACSQEVSVVTFNVRGVMDRWVERAPLLAQCLKELDADVVAFQEVLTGEFAQDQRLLGASYSIHECRAALSHLAQAWGLGGYVFAATVRSLLAFSLTRGLMVGLPEWIESWREQYQLSADWARLLRDLAMAPFFGNSIASRLPCASSCGSCEVLMLGDFRAAQRVCLSLSPADSEGDAAFKPLLLWLVNTHLDHAEPERRASQACQLVAWMEGVKEGAAGIVVTGDLNAPPYEDTHKHLEAAGYASASKAANGKEPDRTWPSGLIAPLMDHGEAHCADYVYVWQAPGHELSVLSAELRGDAPAAADATLYPSDHVAIKVRLRVRRTGH